MVPVEDVRDRGGNEAVRPLATFIAQMLACRAKVADFRQHRRAQPPAAVAAYTAAPTPKRTRLIERTL